MTLRRCGVCAGEPSVWIDGQSTTENPRETHQPEDQTCVVVPLHPTRVRRMREAAFLPKLSVHRITPDPRDKSRKAHDASSERAPYNETVPQIALALQLRNVNIVKYGA